MGGKDTSSPYDALKNSSEFLRSSGRIFRSEFKKNQCKIEKYLQKQYGHGELDRCTMLGYELPSE